MFNFKFKNIENQMLTKVSNLSNLQNTRNSVYHATMLESIVIEENHKLIHKSTSNALLSFLQSFIYYIPNTLSFLC